MTVVVRRSALKMWLMALGGIPLLVISLDVLTNRRLTNRLREMLFRPEATQIFEPRDVIWAWAMLLFSLFVIFWGLKELFVPTRVIECNPDGLSARLLGPFRKPTLIPWSQIVDVRGTIVVDEGKKVPMLEIEMTSGEGVPENPWGARWKADRVLTVLGEDWIDTPQHVATQIADYAVENARNASREAVASIWKADPSRVAPGAHVRHGEAEATNPGMGVGTEEE